MKLELKHLAPYLPYGLKAVKGVTRVEITAVSIELPHVYHTSYLGSRLRVVSKIEEIKLILRPLSDLTKEIEHNGEKFVPIDFINCEFACNVPNKIEWNQSVRNKNLHFVLSEWISPKDLYGLFELLFKWNFDIFGLIEKGLAIDINTLEK